MARSARPWKFVPDDVNGIGNRIIDADGKSIMGNQLYYPWINLDDEDWEDIVSCINQRERVLKSE